MKAVDDYVFVLVAWKQITHRTDNEVVFFYIARGAQEKEFDELKNDFG